MIKNNIGVAVIGSKSYAVNLLWGSAQGTETTEQALNKGLSLVSSELYSIVPRFQGEQFALGDKGIGHKRGLITLLSAIGFDGSSFCGLFPTDNGLWLVIGVDKEGMVHFDKSFDRLEYAKDFFLDNVAYGYPWDKIYSPSNVGIGESGNIADFLLVKGKKLKEKGIRQLRPIFFSGLGVMIFFILLYNIMDLWLSGNDKSVNSIPEPSIREVVRDIPWGGKSDPMSLLTQCMMSMDSLRFLAASIPGWMPENKANCNDAVITFSVQRSGGLDIWYEAAHLFFQEGKVPKIKKMGKDKIELSWPLDTTKYGSSRLEENLMERTKNIERYLSTQFENSWVDIRYGKTVKDGAIEEVEFSFSFRNDPRILLPILTKVDGLTITRINYDFSSGIWNFNGIFWGRA